MWVARNMHGYGYGLIIKSSMSLSLVGGREIRRGRWSRQETTHGLGLGSGFGVKVSGKGQW